MTDDGNDTLPDTPPHAAAGPSTALIGRVLDNRYEIRAPLGSGGMGAVYRGWQRSVDREVAIKIIDPRLAANRDGVKRFLREARLASRLSAPTIVSVFDFGQTSDDVLYIVMELLRGRTLGHVIADGPLPLPRAIRIALQLCDALEAAHAAGIVHRDLKPGNIVVLDDPPGRDLVKVLDFGLAKSLVDDGISLVTQSAALIGTPLYMSPEQIRGRPSDQRSDLYSLGCILHEMTSGTSPFGAATFERILSNHLYEISAPLPQTIPLELAELIRRSIAKDPSDRPATAAEMRAALLAIRDASPAPSARRRWWPAIIAATIVGGSIGGIALVAMREPSATPPANTARVVDAAPSDVRANDTSTTADASTTADSSTPDSSPTDAATIDSASPVVSDAGHASPRDAAPIRRPPIRPPDAAELDFYPSKP